MMEITYVEIVVDAVLVVLGGAYVLSQLTGDGRDATLVRTIENIVKWMWRRS